MGIVAAAQIASIYFDARATAERVAERIAEAARSDAWLVVFTESCIPGYPDWVWRVPSRSSSPSAEPFSTFERRFVEQAITVPGPETDIIAAACRAHHIMAAVGVTERPAGSGTLYNTLLYFGPDGALLGRHRKLVPTFAEKLVWGAGDGTTLRTITTPHGILGGLICWEISVGVLMRETDLTPDLRALGIYQLDELIGPGDSVIVDPLGNIVAGPAHGSETILYADAPAEATLTARRGFDAVGHYGRGDIFSLTLRGVPIPLEINAPLSMSSMSDHIWKPCPGEERENI